MLESFVQRFEMAWQNPSAEGLVALLCDDVVLYQPGASPIKGKQAAYTDFSRLLSSLPGMYGVVKKSVETEDIAFIDWEIVFVSGKKALRVSAIDKFYLRDGLAYERTVYFDQLALYLSLMRHPGLWLGFGKYRFG